MIKSMTGYGKKEYQNDNYRLAVEVKSLNHRYCEVKVRVGKRYTFLENKIKKLIQDRFSRGSFEIFIIVDYLANNSRKLVIDFDSAQKLHHSLKEIKSTLKMPGKVDLSLLARFRDLFLKTEEATVEDDKLWIHLQDIINDSLNSLEIMREEEGKVLCRDIQARVEILTNILIEIEQRSPEVTLNYKNRLTKKLEELNLNITFNEDRLAQEIAIFAERSDITEENTRLQSHLQQLPMFLESDHPVGRKLDFLLQEMNREINTIGSKANDITISQKVIMAKSELEKIREQIQNIE